MLKPVTLKTGATGPALRVQIIDAADGQPKDLTGASARFTLVKLAGAEETETIETAATVETPATDGIVRYDWVAGDTDVAGKYQGQFEVTFDDDTIEHFPPGLDFIEIEFVESLFNVT